MIRFEIKKDLFNFDTILSSNLDILQRKENVIITTQDEQRGITIKNWFDRELWYLENGGYD